jgi:hypothetical protein
MTALTNEIHFTEYKTAQGNRRSKQKTKGGKNKLMNIQNWSEYTKLVYKENYECY